MEEYPSEITAFGIEHNETEPRSFFKVKFTDNNFKYPTLTGEKVDTMPFYVSTGTNFSRDQKRIIITFFLEYH